MKVYMCDRCQHYYPAPTNCKRHLTSLSINLNGIWKAADLCEACSKLLDEWYANLPGDNEDELPFE